MSPLLIFAGFFFFSVAYNMLGPLATNIMSTTGMSLTASGSLLSIQQVGAVISIALLIFLQKRIKQSSIMRFGYIVIIFSFFLITSIQSTYAVFTAYLMLGFGSFLVDSGTNSYLASTYFEKRALYIPLLHFVYSAGAIATGYLILPFKNEKWFGAYTTVGIIFLIILTAQLLNNRKERLNHDGQPRRKEIVQGPVLPLLKDPAFLLYTSVILLYMGSQIVCSAWIPVYVETELGQSAAVTGTSLTLFWAGTALSRLIIGPILNKGGKPYILSIWGMLLAGLSLFAAGILTTNIVIVLILVTLCGFFAGSTIPMYLVVCSTWYPNNTTFISLSYILSGTIGRMIFPFLVAYIASFTNLGFSLGLSSGMLFISALIILIVKKITVSRPEYK
ncbi:MAG: MFS transporter [Sphaerochaetaceae bacterium]|nr:MFS transporter [Sphaerochaetaceae bacterium]